MRWGCFKIANLKWNSFPADIIEPLKDVERVGFKWKQIYLCFKVFKQFQLILERLMQYHRPWLFEVYVDQGRCGASCCVGKSNVGSLGGKLEGFTDWRKFEGQGPVADPFVNHFVMFEFTDMFWLSFQSISLQLMCEFLYDYDIL